MNPTQTQAGKALEFALATELAKYLEIPIEDTPEKAVGQAAFLFLAPEEQRKAQKAADEAITFILAFEKELYEGTSILLQPDNAGQQGDPRDIVVKTPNGKNIGISSKNRHFAIKHSRLSDKIDFGKKWADYPCSSAYMKAVKPVFDDLRQKRKEGVCFHDIADKANRYYLPILNAFQDELQTLCENYGQLFVKRMFQYLLGKYDFYKVVKENGHVIVQSVNINGDLKWGKHWTIPSRIENIQRKRGSNDTLIVSFVDGWQLSFRIHNAKEMCEPSLKFDIKFIGLPEYVARHTIEYHV